MSERKFPHYKAVFAIFRAKETKAPKGGFFLLE